ncbi:hypothetical protein [Verrucomicrobium spinosum]|uniref:hypothetical protein n=1 Tax=Verrucomicrobium spinosum TaxID=2736 RepID=UPI000A9B7C2F|nr:hypothetical protein [Verrucomicrobium spinosum]
MGLPGRQRHPGTVQAAHRIGASLYYEWDAAKGQFLFKGTAPRPDDVEFLFMETGEKVE